MKQSLQHASSGFYSWALLLRVKGLDAGCKYEADGWRAGLLERGHPVRQRAKPAQARDKEPIDLFALRAQADRMSALH
jgi:hypothetical protein